MIGATNSGAIPRFAARARRVRVGAVFCGLCLRPVGVSCLFIVVFFIECFLADNSAKTLAGLAIVQLLQDSDKVARPAIVHSSGCPLCHHFRLPTAITWAWVRKKTVPSDMAGVAMQTSPI